MENKQKKIVKETKKKKQVTYFKWSVPFVATRGTTISC